MKKSIFFLLMLFSCKEDKQEPIVSESNTLEPYIRNLLLPDTSPPYIGDYYIHVDYTNLRTLENAQLTFSERNQSMTAWYSPADNGLGMSYQYVNFWDSETSENLEISFYFNTDTDSTFNITYADYFYADPWRNVAGANIEYFVPVNVSDSSTKYRYLGANSSESFFMITYIGNNRLNGIFRTTWKECCGGNITFEVYGDFSIPDIRYFLN